MEYRRVPPAENGFENVDEQLTALRGGVQHTMYTTGPNELLDLLVVIANICEQRTLIYKNHKELSGWYNLLGLLTRGSLELTTTMKDGPRPQIDLEDPSLYFPDVEHIH